MTQTKVKQQPKTAYPTCRMLVVRDCMKVICLQHSSATRMLSVLMHRYDYSNYPTVNGLFTVTCTQADIVRDACDEISEKTIQSVAGPFLQLLGFLDVEERMGGNRYTLHIDIIHEALRLYAEDKGQLENFLIRNLQLERFLIDPSDVLESENSLINRKKLQSQLEKVLIAIGKSSNCRRGRKPKQQASSEDNLSETESNRELQENITENERKGDDDPPTSSPPDASLTHSSSDSHSISQGGVTNHPPSDKGVSSDESGVQNRTDPGQSSQDTQPLSPDPSGVYTSLGENKNDSHIATVPSMPNSSGEPQHSVAILNLPPQTVMKNDTPMDEVGEVTQAMLLSWCAKLQIKIPKKPDIVKQHCDKLLALPVRTKKDVQALRDIVKHPDVALGNLANDDVIRAWQEVQLSVQAKEYTPSECGMTEAERDELVSGVLAYCPDFVVNGTLDAPYFVAIYESETEIIELGHPDDWGRIPQARLQRAAEFGARYWQQQAAPQEEPIVDQEEAQQQATPEPSEMREFGMAEATCNALMDVIHKWSPSLKIKPLLAIPERDRWTIQVLFGDLGYQYFEVENHTAWKGIKQDDMAMLACAVQYGMSLQEMAVAV